MVEKIKITNIYVDGKSTTMFLLVGIYRKPTSSYEIGNKNLNWKKVRRLDDLHIPLTGIGFDFA